MNVLPVTDPEFRALIPPLSNDEYGQLEQNILSGKKCRDPLILWDGVIVDGHNRFEICKKHGIEFEIVEKSFECREDAMAWIIENQLGRRNLTDGARIELALFKGEITRKKAKINQSKAGGDKKTDASLFTKKAVTQPINVSKGIAEDAGVGSGTLQRYMQIKENGSPQLLESVKNGELKIGTAHRLLSNEISAQLRLAGKMYKFIAKNYPFENNDAANYEIHERLSALCGNLNEVLTKLEVEKNHAPEN